MIIKKGNIITVPREKHIKQMIKINISKKDQQIPWTSGYHIPNTYRHPTYIPTTNG